LEKVEPKTTFSTFKKGGAKLSTFKKGGAKNNLWKRLCQIASNFGFTFL